MHERFFVAEAMPVVVGISPRHLVVCGHKTIYVFDVATGALQRQIARLVAHGTVAWIESPAVDRVLIARASEPSAFRSRVCVGVSTSL